MLGSFRKSPAQGLALAQVQAWTRDRFKLEDAEVVLVSELACAVPGCPPIETVVAFWTMDAVRHQFKVFKPVVDVLPSDLPYAWLKPSLIAIEGMDGECC